MLEPVHATPMPDSTDPLRAAFERAQPEELSAALVEAARTGGLEQLPSLGALLLGEPETRDLAAAAIDAILSRHGAAGVLGLEQQRSGRWWERWWSVRPHTVKKLGKRVPALLWLASAHRNGRVREAAVRALGQDPDPRGLAFVLVRLNDWVTPVRDAANQAVAVWLGADVSRWVSSLPLLLHLRTCRRVDHAPFVTRAIGSFPRETWLGALPVGFDSEDRLVRRAAFELAFELASELGEDDGRSIAQRGLASIDLRVRLRAMRWVVTEASSALRAELAPLLFGDKMVSIRRAGLRLLAEYAPERAEPVLLRALFDRARAVRETARFHLLRRTGPDLAALFRATLRETEEPARLAGALDGLAATGGPDDAAAVEELLAHDSGRVRAEAVAALARLGGDDDLRGLAILATDEAAAVRRRVFEMLRKTPASIPTRELSADYEGAPAQVQRSLLRLIAAAPPWNALAALIGAAAHVEAAWADEASSFCRRIVTRFDSRVFTAPDAEQLAAIAAALAAAEDAFDPALRRAIEDLIERRRRTRGRVS